MVSRPWTGGQAGRTFTAANGSGHLRSIDPHSLVSFDLLAILAGI